MIQHLSSGPAMHLVHVARQPIFDLSGDVVAYELLFRGRMDAIDAERRDSYATSQVIVNSFTEFGIDEVVGDQACFINLTREFLVGELPLPFGPEQVVLEVLETVEVDDAVVDGVTALVEAGYRIALDDFVWGSGHERLLPLASYVKLDLLHGDTGHLDELVANCRKYPGIQIVAEGLETPAHLALSHKYNCELRQGYVLSRPQVLTAASISPSRLRRLELVGALSSPETDLETVLSIIAHDPALTMRVLRASNSAAVGAAFRISSVRQAVVMVGLDQIRHWAMLMVVDDVTEATEAQLVEVLTRARLCVNLAGTFGADPDAAFVAGLITAVAAMIGMSPAMLAHHLPLTDDIETALGRGAGQLGRLLRTVEAYQRGDFEGLAEQYSGTDLTRTVMDAMRWSKAAAVPVR
ncbi:EAL and HDOD domain-containing protein [Paractinoplanes rishiriensis]|uniref:Histidine kinase n=1 Tax=Paractinoplanes rishiriensis TaxID=1050105 RepID=A0A919K090_9ACTN|nr:HDOD domain-containing protein [Actinoplanes rishiriensis]GIE94241.1 histidine kinase [Actinoplanes rishiriensis]